MGDLFSGPHIILIALVVLLLFGGKKIPELMRGLGKGIREFKNAKDNVAQEIENQVHDNRPPATMATMIEPVPPILSETSNKN